MGAPKKWIKALIGLKKSDKPQSPVNDTNCFGCTGNIWPHRKHFAEFGSPEDELNDNVNTELRGSGVANPPTVLNSECLPSTSCNIQHAAFMKLNARDELAAIHIQAAFRGFLARRALRALKGLVKLQAIVRGRAVRKQAAITLQCMEAVVRVQARARARRVNIALENQTQEKLQQQQEHKAHVKEIEDGWCDTVGSVKEIQAKLLKRKEAAAKREKAMSYASARQHQASSRQKAKPVAVEPDKSFCGRNMSERWLLVRPWENRFLEVDLKDATRHHRATELTDSRNVPQTRSISTRRKPNPNIGNGNLLRNSSNNLDVSNVKRTAPPYKGRNPSPNKSSNMHAASAAMGSSRSSKPVHKSSLEESSSRPNIGLRSRSTPKERMTPANEQQKMRLSLQENRHEIGAQQALGRWQPSRTTTSTKRTSTPPPAKPGRPKPK